MAPKMGYNTINEDAVDAETEALIVRLIAMELDEIPTSLSGSSTETLVEVNDRMKQQAANIIAHQKLIEKEGHNPQLTEEGREQDEGAHTCLLDYRHRLHYVLAGFFRQHSVGGLQGHH